jgi:hypothetical protein
MMIGERHGGGKKRERKPWMNELGDGTRKR